MTNLDKPMYLVIRIKMNTYSSNMKTLNLNKQKVTIIGYPAVNSLKLGM